MKLVAVSQYLEEVSLPQFSIVQPIVERHGDSTAGVTLATNTFIDARTQLR